MLAGGEHSVGLPAAYSASQLTATKVSMAAREAGMQVGIYTLECPHNSQTCVPARDGNEVSHMGSLVLNESHGITTQINLWPFFFVWYFRAGHIPTHPLSQLFPFSPCCQLERKRECTRSLPIHAYSIFIRGGGLRGPCVPIAHPCQVCCSVVGQSAGSMRGGGGLHNYPILSEAGEHQTHREWYQNHLQRVAH
jgi:hypothetical protein